MSKEANLYSKLETGPVLGMTGKQIIANMIRQVYPVEKSISDIISEFEIVYQ